jgi:AhpD family alkylhydroperoxidase
MAESISDFNAFRSRMNDIILNAGNLTINRFFALDHRCYEPGALGTKTKEMLGLVSSLVLRCDDCITYHVVRCHAEGATREEFLEIFSVGLVVGGSIVIPHLRRAMARLEELDASSEFRVPSSGFRVPSDELRTLPRDSALRTQNAERGTRNP